MWFYDSAGCEPQAIPVSHARMCVLIAWKCIPIRKELSLMSNIKYNTFISVSIDVGADFSWMSMAILNQTFVGKPFKILHSDLNSLSMATFKIKEAIEMYSYNPPIFMSSFSLLKKALIIQFH